MDDATAAAEPAYDTKVEDVGPATKRLTITVPAEAIAEKIEDSIGALAVQTALPGFRKGRAPRALLERRFGAAVRTETKSQIVADAYAAAIEKHELKPVGEPEPVDDLEDVELDPQKPITFSVDVEVVPEFELPSIEGVAIRKPIVDVTDERVEEELQRHAIEQGTPEEIDSGFEPGDRLVGPAVVTKEGEDEPVFKHDQVVVIMPGQEDGGRGQVLGLMIDGLAGMLAGTPVGETVTIGTTGPEGHERDDIRGAKLTIAFEIRHAYRIHPASEEDLVGVYGLGSAVTLREQMRLALVRRRDVEQHSVMREQVHEHLLRSVDIELPKRLSAAQAQRSLDRARMELLYGGLTPEQVEDRLAEIRADSDEAAHQRLKLFFILHKLADELKVDVSEQEINGRIAAIAAQRGDRPERLRQDLIRHGRIGSIAAQIREHKAADRVIHGATITEIPAAEWNEEVRKKAESQRSGKKTSTKSGKKTSTTTKKKKKPTA